MDKEYIILLKDPEGHWHIQRTFTSETEANAEVDALLTRNPTLTYHLTEVTSIARRVGGTVSREIPVKRTRT